MVAIKAMVFTTEENEDTEEIFTIGESVVSIKAIKTLTQGTQCSHFRLHHRVSQGQSKSGEGTVSTKAIRAVSRPSTIRQAHGRQGRQTERRRKSSAGGVVRRDVHRSGGGGENAPDAETRGRGDAE